MDRVHLNIYWINMRHKKKKTRVKAKAVVHSFIHSSCSSAMMRFNDDDKFFGFWCSDWSRQLNNKKLFDDLNSFVILNFSTFAFFWETWESLSRSCRHKFLPANWFLLNSGIFYSCDLATLIMFFNTSQAPKTHLFYKDEPKEKDLIRELL